jgi:hypothetical protein
MTEGRVEVITSVQRPRRWSQAEKERIVAAALVAGANASGWRARLGFTSARFFGRASGRDPPAAVFYSPDRGAKHPEQHLAGYAVRVR